MMNLSEPNTGPDGRYNRCPVCDSICDPHEDWDAERGCCNFCAELAEIAAETETAAENNNRLRAALEEAR